MKINFLGDSITWGVGASVRENSYVMQVGDMLGCEVCNFGANGTRIAKQHSVSENPAFLSTDHCIGVREPVRMKPPSRLFILEYGIPISSP